MLHGSDALGLRHIWTGFATLVIVCENIIASRQAARSLSGEFILIYSLLQYGFFEELGRYPMKSEKELIIICFNIFKSTNSLIINIYKMLTDDANNGLTYSGLNWTHHVKCIL